MKFVRSLRTKRSARSPEEFCIEADVDALRSEGHTLCEFLNGAARTKLYLDYDHVLDSEPNESEIRAIKEGVLRHTKELAEIICMPDYVVASRHGAKGDKFKVSFRVFFRGFTVVYHDIPILIKFVEQEAIWDLSPYKRTEQLLACINGKKGGGDDRVLKPEPEFAGRDLKDFVAQAVDPEWPFLDLGAFQRQRDERASGVGQGVSASVRTREPSNNVRMLAAMLSPARASRRGDWIKVGLLLKRLGAFTEAGENIDAENVYYEDWRDFSRRADDPVKIASDSELERVWAGFRVDAPSALGEGSLHAWAKEDDPEQYSATTELRSLAFVADGSASDEQRAELVRALKTHVPGMAETLSDDTVFRADKGIVRFDASGGGGAAAVSKCEIDVHTYAVTVDGEYKGMVCGRDVPLRTQIHKFHTKLPENLDFIFNRDAADKATLTSIQGGVKIEIHDIFQPRAKAFFVKAETGSARYEMRVANVRALQEEIIKTSLRDQFQAQYPNAINIFNNCTIVVNQGAEDDGIDMREIAKTIIATCPSVVERIVFNPNLKSRNNSGCFFCVRETNVWKAASYPYLEEELIGVIPEESFTPKVHRFMNRKAGRSEVLYIVTCKRQDETFPDRFNSDLRVFPMANMLLDTAGDMRLRPIQMNDYILDQYTAGWDYDPELSARHKDEVLDFVSKIFPVENERHIALAFVASMLSGIRAKKMLLLTDKRSGENGKTVFVRMVKSVFGKLAAERREFLLQSTSQKDRNGHDAGMQAMAKKRLLVCEELSNSHTLDVGFIKTLTSGDGAEMEGRGFDTAASFRFTWEAGVIVTFNQGCMPKLGTLKDDPEAFWKRVIVCPMRARFEDQVAEDAEEYTFKKDVDIVSNFKNWRSAFLDLLIEHWDPELLNSERVGSDKWRGELAVESNPMAEWLSNHIQVTGDKKDVLKRDDIVDKYLRERNENSLPVGKVKELVMNYLKVVCLRYREIGNLKVSGRFVSARHLATGVKLSTTSSQAENELATLIEEEFGITLIRNIRPPWLRVPGKSSTLELDMFLTEKNLAIEYDGPQHYEFPNPFHSTRSEFEHQQKLDRLKEELCAKKGVTLVRIRHDLQDPLKFLARFF